MKPNNMHRKQVRDLLLPGIYNFPQPLDEATEEKIIDQCFEVYQRKGLKAAADEMRRLQRNHSDGVAISRIR